ARHALTRTACRFSCDLWEMNTSSGQPILILPNPCSQHPRGHLGLQPSMNSQMNHLAKNAIGSLVDCHLQSRGFRFSLTSHGVCVCSSLLIILKNESILSGSELTCDAKPPGI